MAQDFNIRCGCTLWGLRDDVGKVVGSSPEHATISCHIMMCLWPSQLAALFESFRETLLTASRSMSGFALQLKA
jgi:hypothetical protein